MYDLKMDGLVTALGGVFRQSDLQNIVMRYDSLRKLQQNTNGDEPYYRMDHSRRVNSISKALWSSYPRGRYQWKYRISNCLVISQSLPAFVIPR